jgi:hypothetical protein
VQCLLYIVASSHSSAEIWVYGVVPQPAHPRKLTEFALARRLALGEHSLKNGHVRALSPGTQTLHNQYR